MRFLGDTAAMPGRVGRAASLVARTGAMMLAGLMMTLAAPGRAQNPPLQQNGPIQLTPLPPLQRQWQQQGAPPVPQAPAPAVSGSGLPSAGGVGAGGVGPAVVSPGVPGPDAQTQAPPPATMERPNVWLPATVAKLQALDKVNAQAAALTIKVGQSATFGSLTITVKACVTRPSDQAADAAAFLAVTDSHPDQPGFDGWMLEDEPAVSMMQHPIYDLRVTGCT